jgi:hypothetical protein
MKTLDKNSKITLGLVAAMLVLAAGVQISLAFAGFEARELQILFNSFAFLFG